MASISATLTPTPIIGDYSLDVKNYSNYSMVMRGLLLDNPRIASKYTAEYVRFLLANRSNIHSKDPLIIRFSNPSVSSAQLAKVMGGIVSDEKDGVSIAGDVLITLSKINKWKVHSTIDSMMKANKVAAGKVIAYMKAKGYNPMLLFKY